jgi:hypothetical protein
MERSAGWALRVQLLAARSEPGCDDTAKGYLMPKVANLARERVKRTLAELARTRAEVQDEIRKSQFNRVRSKLARKRRQVESPRPD